MTKKLHKSQLFALALMLCLAVWVGAGCTKPAGYRLQADQAAAKIIEQKQLEALGHSEPFTIERPADTLRRRILLASGLPYSGNASLGTDQLEPIEYWPEKDYPPRPRPDAQPALGPWNDKQPLRLTLIEALQVAARNNRDYQSQKEDIFRAALDLDLERDDFRNTFAGSLESIYSADLGGDHSEIGIENSITADVARQLKSGAALSARIAVDLVKLLTLDKSSSFGIFADATVAIPLLRGSGKHIVSEPLQQAERNVIYAIYRFERFKRTLAVRVASEYLAVLQQLDRVKNAEENYQQLLDSTQRARKMAQAARLPAIQVGQALQDELRARDRWIRDQQSYARRLDSFKITLGLPTDANIELEQAELERLADRAKKAINMDSPPVAPIESQTRDPATANAQMKVVPPSRKDGGPLELEPARAVTLALENRLDLRTALGRVYDAQRAVVVAADNLRTDLTLAARAQAGDRRSLSSADSPNAQLRPEKGFYSVGLLLDLPLERTAERNVYRDSFISLERAVRSVQELEDQIKLGVRNDLRDLLQARESTKIQAQAVNVARRRVASTELFLQAERAEMRDFLEAQESLVSAQNQLTAALVNYRVAELDLQLDMDLLEVSEKGLWREYRPQDDESK